MRERNKEIRRRRHRKEKVKKAKIRALIAQARASSKSKPAEAPQKAEEKKAVHKPAAKVVRSAKGSRHAAEGEKKGE